jgi:beta-glucosidase
MLDRRQFLASVASLSALAALPGRVDAAAKYARFPQGFMWGAATASYQIEGAYAEDGKGENIWDRFVLAPGKILDGSTGNVACDSYHRWAEDIELLKQIGAKSYRFSISWARIQPTGKGAANQKGLDYYERLTDGLLRAGIRPLPTLYHWDLPQALEDEGGWPKRELSDRFAEYAAITAGALGDRVQNWVLFNEPKTFVEAGYLTGSQAPGRKDPAAFLKATHVVNLAQGKAFSALKSLNSGLNVGGAFDVSPMVPMTSSPQDAAAALRYHKFLNLWYLETALTGAYPTGVLPPELQDDLLDFRPGDDKLIRAQFDFIGLNNYTRYPVKYDPAATGVPGLLASGRWSEGDHEKTDFGWDIDPDGFYTILKLIHETTGAIPIEITENGAAYNETPGADGQVHDLRRIAYLNAYISAVARAIADGVPIRGYHVWSLLDNFEWTAGYSQRFGLVHVDFATQKRTLKDSAKWYADLIAANKLRL